MRDVGRYTGCSLLSSIGLWNLKMVEKLAAAVQTRHPGLAMPRGRSGGHQGLSVFQ